VPKVGNGFDLAIAGAILDGSHQLDGRSPSTVMMIGELHLGGAIGAVRGVLAAVVEGMGSEIAGFVVPRRNAAEARSVSGGRAVGIGHLSELPGALATLSAVATRPTPSAADRFPTAPTAPGPAPGSALHDFRELRGLSDLKRLLEIAAAGGHHVLVVGPPGGGKSAAVGLFPTILMPLSWNESIEVTRIHSLADDARPRAGLHEHRPFRSPHHNASTEGLLGGRSPQIPGEVALAHCGTLFLDEALEFRRPVLQGMREPLEHRRIRVARARGNYWFPASIQLIMATNRCPCGLLGRRDRSCLCSLAEVDRYWRKLGGPLLDRIDLRIHVEPHPLEVLPRTDSSAEMARRARAAVMFRETVRQQSYRNAELTADHAMTGGMLADPGRRLLAEASRAFGLSTRASLSIIRVARTIADLSGEERVGEEHVLEAVSYRRFGEERPLWEADAV
jgi:magnesium chelatase family protein